jgi:riboflavin kinase / FMN adenylyltransferase
MMRVLHGIDGLLQVPAGAAMSIGNFDGLHRGHARILELCRKRRNEGASAAAVVTFEPHPLTVLRPRAAAPRLTPPELKQELIESLGVDVYVVLPPEPSVLNLTAQEFWLMLRDRVRPSYLIEGPDFNFGKDRQGTAQQLAEWAADSPVRFDRVPPLEGTLLNLNRVPISSSLIRWLLTQGRVRDAAICLGRPYLLRGEVVKGFQRGRELGAPTANLRCEAQLIPADGVYAGRCRVGSTVYPAAVSIGDMPTFGEGVRQIEAYLIGFDGDLYGQTLDLELLDWLREQRKFARAEALSEQIDRDVVQTRRRSEMDPSAPIVQEV